MPYETWINERFNDIKSTMGMCREACEVMKKDFPELNVTNGFVHLLDIDEPQMHWWLKKSDGEIVDPTKFQYVWNGTPIMHYEEIDASHPARNFPRRKCMNCGKYYYQTEKHFANVCSEKCSKEFESYLNGEIDEF